MSLTSIADLYWFMRSSSSVTSLVSENNIKVGWTKTLDSFPCIILTQTGGTDTGYLGYKSAPAGSRLRLEDAVFTVDIFSRSSRMETYQIADVITPLFIVSGACRKEGDIDLFDNDMNVYRKMQTYRYKLHHDD